MKRDLPRRAYLTVRHHGWGELGLRILTSPLRLVGFDRELRAELRRRVEDHRLRLAFRAGGHPVTIVMPTYGPPDTTLEALAAVRRTIDPERVRVVVVDDASAPQHQARLRAAVGAEVVLAERNGGYSASVNLGLRRARPGDDVVVLNNDVLPRRGWLERLQRRARRPGVGAAGARLLYPDGRIQSAGTYRNLTAPEWFDHRYRFKPARHGPARVAAEALAVTGACMYLPRAALDAVGRFDERYPMGYEDVDWCLRAWEAGLSVVYEPDALLTHAESITRGSGLGARERRSQERFWERWGDWFDGRSVRTPDGRLRVVYVTEGTGVGGGHRDVFEHLNRLAARGHAVELWSLEGPPDWFELRAPVRSFGSYPELAAALSELDAIKVATWWATAPFVWRAALRRGVPVYFVQDIETSYYGDLREMQHRVLASYREEFRYLTISSWNRDRLGELGLEAELIAPGIDLDNFRPLELERSDDVVLALGRANPLKDLPLTIDAMRLLEPRARLWMFGVEPELGALHGARYFEAPSDAEVNELLARAAVFVQTSRHEGFALPPLEAMAAGTPVVCTDAHGNRDFCRHERNCLMVERDPRAVADAIERLLEDAALRERLVAEGRRTAAAYAWGRRVDELERFLERVADDAGRRRAGEARALER